LKYSDITKQNTFVNSQIFSEGTTSMILFKQPAIGILLVLAIGSLANAEESTVLINKTYNLGDSGPQGGKVYVIDSSGQHGLEAKPADQPDSLIWRDAVTGAEAYGSGWHLPTIAELKLLYKQKMQVGGFANDDYWSSTEQDVNSAWIQGFARGDQDRYNKHSKLKVRAVRVF
jgi:hypothetical protein